MTGRDLNMIIESFVPVVSQHMTDTQQTPWGGSVLFLRLSCALLQAL